MEVKNGEITQKEKNRNEEKNSNNSKRNGFILSYHKSLKTINLSKFNLEIYFSFENDFECRRQTVNQALAQILITYV